MKLITNIYKAFNPNYVPVHYYNRTTAIYHLYNYTIKPLLYITTIGLLASAGLSLLNQ